MSFLSINSYEEFEQFAGGMASIATALAVFVGAIWAYLRFVRQEEKHPYINFTADINFICRQQGFWIVELISVIENKGKVPHKFKVFEFDLNALFPGDQIELNEQFGGQAFFPHEITKGSWKPEKFKYFFISPGTTSKYSFVTRVPDKATAIMLHSWFEYEDRKKAGHTAERTVRLPSSASCPANDQDQTRSETR